MTPDERTLATLNAQITSIECPQEWMSCRNNERINFCESAGLAQPSYPAHWVHCPLQSTARLNTKKNWNGSGSSMRILMAPCSTQETIMTPSALQNPRFVNIPLVTCFGLWMTAWRVCRDSLHIGSREGGLAPGRRNASSEGGYHSAESSSSSSAASQATTRHQPSHYFSSGNPNLNQG